MQMSTNIAPPHCPSNPSKAVYKQYAELYRTYLSAASNVAGRSLGLVREGKVSMVPPKTSLVPGPKASTKTPQKPPEPKVNVINRGTKTDPPSRRTLRRRMQRKRSAEKKNQEIARLEAASKKSKQQQPSKQEKLELELELYKKKKQIDLEFRQNSRVDIATVKAKPVEGTTYTFVGPDSKRYEVRDISITETIQSDTWGMVGQTGNTGSTRRTLEIGSEESVNYRERFRHVHGRAGPKSWDLAEFSNHYTLCGNCQRNEPF